MQTIIETTSEREEQEQGKNTVGGWTRMLQNRELGHVWSGQRRLVLGHQLSEHLALVLAGSGFAVPVYLRG